MSSTTPGEIEVYSLYRKHLGPRMEAAGLRVQFHYNQKPGIHFKIQPREEEYRNAILKGIEEGMAARFPNFPSTGSIWITEISEHEVDSCELAFYRAGRLVIDQAYSLAKQPSSFVGAGKHFEMKKPVSPNPIPPSEWKGLA
jgi:hypothetical protein